MWERFKEYFRDSYLHPRYIANREILRFVRQHGNRFNGIMLDVGCGKRPYAGFFPAVSAYVGMDVPTSMHGTGGIDVAGSVLQLPFADQTFDSILCAEVLEHTPDPSQALREMARVSRPGAQLLVTVPLSEPLHEEPFDYCRFTRYWLVHLFEKSGWRVVKLEARGGAWLEQGYRISSLLYSSLGSSKLADGNLRPRMLMGPVVVCLCAGVQLGATFLDRCFENRTSTIGWCAIGERQ